MVTIIAGIVFNPLKKKSKIEPQKKLCKNKDFCSVIMPPQAIRI